ncbi:MAG: DUF2950 domain-containing protein [Chromatiales bacterium]|nr:DUF2950 domain-containing protein [Chromatiales bacterium]
MSFKVVCRTGFGFIACVALLGLCVGAAAQAAAPQKTFATPEEAVAALVSAAESFDVPALKAILGPDGVDLVVSDDPVLDRNHSIAFAEQARLKNSVERDPGKPGRATMLVGEEDWPSPIPIVEERGRWRFDSKAGRQEILLRRIGQNELDAIDACRGYVEAQYEYASQKRDGAQVNQYAQRVISTPGRRDGLAWQGADGTWEGPVGEGIARVIAEGYSDRYEPFHGYYFKILKGQGPAAPMGQMDFVINGVMIGGFALVAAPAEYGVTGVKTFIVGPAGIVYEKDLGPGTLKEFRAMERYNPDTTWTPVSDP